MSYWLLKSEPTSYSTGDLRREGKTAWEGVRNFQARNFLRDSMKVGDLALFYHSATEVPAVAGIARIASEAYPDPTQFDAKSMYFDPTATKENPRWYVVDVEFAEAFAQPLALSKLHDDTALVGMELLRRGSRLSVQPVTKEHFVHIKKRSARALAAA
jgi:predicted RNA-binding protein with PUA-like domain